MIISRWDKAWFTSEMLLLAEMVTITTGVLTHIRTFSRIDFKQLTQECTLPSDEVSIGNFLYVITDGPLRIYMTLDIERLISDVADCHYNLWSTIVS